MLSVLSAIGLCACGGAQTSSGEGTFAGIENSSVKSFVQGANNAEITTQASYLLRDRQADTVAVGAAKPITAQALPQADGSVNIRVKALGHDVTFKPEHLEAKGNQYTIVLSDGVTMLHLWTRHGTFPDILSGATDYDYVFSVGFADYASDTGVNNRLEGVFGLLTSPTSLPVAGDARFTGEVNGVSYIAGSADNRETLKGAMTLDVNFETKQISGDITGVAPVDDPSGAFDLQVNPTRYAQGGFQTDLTLHPTRCGALCGASVTSQMNGAFYGDKAQEVGGNISATLNATNPRVFSGSFLAAQ